MSLSNIAAMPGKTGALLRLMRVDRPIGTYLLLWPTLMALWLAAGGVPSIKNLVIFILGTFLMRSAGCVLNDYLDRDLDQNVARTSARPLASGELQGRDALLLFAGLVLVAFLLVLQTNTLTVWLSIGALAVTCLYPLMKRITQWPQLVLGVAFSFGIPMAFAAESGELPNYIWLLFFANLLWTIAYDTFYAMVDREDDLVIGVKSTAILFGKYDRAITAGFQVLTLVLLVLLGTTLALHWPFYLGLLISAGLFIYHQQLIAARQRDNCFKAFLHNNWVGCCWFVALLLELALFPK